MKVKKLISILQNLPQQYDVHIYIDGASTDGIFEAFVSDVDEVGAEPSEKSVWISGRDDSYYYNSP